MVKLKPRRNAQTQQQLTAICPVGVCNYVVGMVSQRPLSAWQLGIVSIHAEPYLCCCDLADACVTMLLLRHHMLVDQGTHASRASRGGRCADDDIDDRHERQY